MRSAAWRLPSSCCRSPTCCCSTSPPTTSTPRACCGSSSTCRSTPAPCIAITHDRYFLDNVAEWIAEVDRGRLYRLRGQLLDLPREEGRATRRPGQEGREARQAPRRRARVGALQREGPPGRSPSPASRATRRWRPRPTARASSTSTRSRSRPGRAWVRHRDRGEEAAEGLRRPLAHRRTELHAFRRNGIVGVIGPNGVGKTTLFKTIVGLEPLDGGAAEDRRDGQDQLRRPVPLEHRPEQDAVGGRLATASTSSTVGKIEIPSRAYVSQVRLQGPGPAEEGRRALRR